jgi:predicted PurR-regulated permease PerM
MLASAYPFVDILWTLVAFFVLAIWVYLLFKVWANIFRRFDMSGAAKVSWLLLTVLFPFVGVFAYVLTQHDAMSNEDHLTPRLP